MSGFEIEPMILLGMCIWIFPIKTNAQNSLSSFGPDILNLKLYKKFGAIFHIGTIQMHNPRLVAPAHQRSHTSNSEVKFYHLTCPSLPSQIPTFKLVIFVML